MHICSFCLFFVLFDQNGILPQTEDVLKEMLFNFASSKVTLYWCVYMCTFHRWKLRSGASCALVCVAAHLVCIQLTLLRMWSVWCLFLFCHGLMLTDHSLSLSHCPSLSLSLSLFLHLPLSLFLSLHATLLYLELNLRLSPEEPGTCVSAHESSHLCFFCFHTSESSPDHHPSFLIY